MSFNIKEGINATRRCTVHCDRVSETLDRKSVVPELSLEAFLFKALGSMQC